MSDVPHSYIWKETHIDQLIKQRIDKSHWFGGKRGTDKIGWQKLATLLNCGASGEQCQTKWLKLIAKYKIIITPRTGKGLEDKNHEAHTWPYSRRINEYMSGRHTITPLELIDSISGILQRPVTLAPEHAPALVPAPTPVPAPVPSVSGAVQQFRACSKRLVMSDSEVGDDLPDGIVINKKKKAAVVAVEKAVAEIITQMRVQIDRSLDEQAEARRSEKAMLEMLEKFFGNK